MEFGYELEAEIEVNRILLDPENARHERFQSQDQVIQYLCREENVLVLAKDIAANGLNPLDRVGLIPDGDGMYYVIEGNRRVCALKLLHDPELAPDANLRRAFEAAAEGWEPIDELSAVAFEHRDDVKLWLERIHAGYAGGKGRRQWSAEQKTRHTGYTKNLFAQKVLDAGEQRGFISANDRVGRLSTVQRYLSNPLFRNALGLDINDPDNITTTLPDDDFHIVFERFMENVAKRTFSTRDNKQHIDENANQLSAGLTGYRGEPRPIIEETSPGEPGPRRDRPPKRPSRIAHSEKLQNAIDSTENYKLQNIYYSMHKLSLNVHTPLLTVGAWVFVETLTALIGRKAKTDFHSYLNNNKLHQLGLDRDGMKAVREALKRLSENGNTTKHNQSAAAFHGETLANDLATMEELLIALAKEVAKKK